MHKTEIEMERERAAGAYTHLAELFFDEVHDGLHLLLVGEALPVLLGVHELPVDRDLEVPAHLGRALGLDSVRLFVCVCLCVCV